jgi:hypothetical protein
MFVADLQEIKALLVSGATEKMGSSMRVGLSMMGISIPSRALEHTNERSHFHSILHVHE